MDARTPPGPSVARRPGSLAPERLPGAYCVSITGWLDDTSTTPPADWYCVWIEYPGWSDLGTVTTQGDVAQLVEVLVPSGAVTTATTLAALATPAREKPM